VLRCFEDDDITHVEGKIDPVSDAETVETELMLADLESLEKRIKPLEKKANSGEKEAKEQLALMMKAVTLLREGKPARRADLAPEERGPYSQLGLMTAKPVLYVCNVEEASAATGNAISAKVEAMAKAEGARSVVISAKIEEEIAQMKLEDRADFLSSLDLEEPGLNRLIRTGYELLGLLTFFTVGPKEARAWTVTKGSKGPQAAGVIHTDFEQGYIRAETIAFPDYVAGKGEAGAREAGKFRLEGKEYVVADGDVMHFRFNN
jgi:GTP-binding protein YchF